MAEREDDARVATPGRTGASTHLSRGMWGAWWAGTILLVLSWTEIVSPTIGWIGFGIACISVVVSVIANKYWRLPGGTTD
jgi:hypothetical protein